MNIIIFLIGIILGWYLREKLVCLHKEWDIIEQRNLIYNEGDTTPHGKRIYFQCKKCKIIKKKDYK